MTHIFQVLTTTCDNGTNNDTMLDEIHKAFPLFRGSKTRVRCFGHILNLVVKVRFLSHALTDAPSTDIR